MAMSGASTSPVRPGDRVAVLLPLPLAGAYDYRVPDGMELCPGDFVAVPLGNRTVAGVVWGAGEGAVAAEKIKDVIALMDAPPMAVALRRLVDWAAAYTLSAPGAVLRMAMSVPAALEPPRPVTAWRIADGVTADGPVEETDSRIRMTPARLRVLATLAGFPPRPAAELAREAAVTPGVVRGMADAGLLSPVMLTPRRDAALPDHNRAGPALSADQAAAADALAAAVRDAAAAPGDEAGFGVTLLDGVTGSGKTEVYFEAIAAALDCGRQALVMVPEIALTSQWLKRFRERFGAPPAEWHSDLTGAERRAVWRDVAQGRAPVVIGARSALFLPFPDLGLAVVDEEHDAAFKQEDGVIYNARDMAVVRGRLGGFPVVLASATPSLETVTNVEAGRYARLHLPERHGAAELPDIGVIDMRAQDLARQSWISPALAAAVGETLAAGEQAMLFLNRRGYAPLTLCRGCGHRLECPQCTAWLVEHRLEGRLQCHHCGFAAPLPKSCPECGAVDAFAPCGPGVERLAEEAAAQFPDARIDIMASDTIQSPALAEALVRRMQDRAIDVLIGTQIMAKGHHFPWLTLVGAIDADLGLGGGDLRAAERTYQMLHQLAGRAGRGHRPGRVLLQSYMPDHPVMQALVSGDRDRFMAAEAEQRSARGLPPFGRLAALIVTGLDAQAVDRAASALGRTRPDYEGVQVFGPAPAPLAILRGRHRRRLLLKARRDVNMQRVLRDWLARSSPPPGVRVQVDVDPYSFL